MRLDDEDLSSNIEDRRSEGGRPGFGFPGRGGRRIRIPTGGRRGGGIGIGTIIIALIMIFVFKVNPIELLNGGGGFAPAPTQRQVTPQQPGRPDAMKTFVSKVLHTTETTWSKIFAAQGKRYEKPRLVLFSGYVQSACGMAQSAMGPFYCPRDHKVYIDLSFYNDLRNKLGAPGDFAQAYVIAHEIGHHVQNLIGIASAIQAKRARLSRAAGNRLSVRMELQADCFAGVWAAHNKSILDRGDIEEALNAANSIGDDTLQRRSSGRVVPDSFTHGTSAQRVGWFKRGYQSGNMGDCDTFR